MRSRSVRESEIERYLVEQVHQHGGVAYKWVSPGNPGVPDRIVIFAGMVCLVELKQSKGAMRNAQIIQARRLADLGFEVQVIRSKEQAKLWVELNASIANLMSEKR